MDTKTPQVYVFSMKQQAQDQTFEIQGICLCYAETKKP